MAVGRINGTCDGSNGGKYNFWIEWASTPNKELNQSSVSVSAYLQRNDGYAGSAWNNNINKADKYVKVFRDKYESNTNGIDTRNGKKVLIAEVKNYIVHHDENGYATALLTAHFPKVASNLTGGLIREEVALDHIDQKAPSFTSLNIYPISPTEVATDWTADTEIIRQWYSLDGAEWVQYDGKVITGLKPNTNYGIRLQIVKSPTLYTNSAEYYVKTFPILVQSINLQQNIQLDVGVESDFYVNIRPVDASIQKINYSVENPEICRVNSMPNRTTLTALQSGTTTLYAKATDGSGVQESSTVTCRQRVTEISVPNKKITVSKGGTVILNYKVLPETADNKNVSITVEEQGIVLIDGNKVAGIENGTAHITITTEDGAFSETVIVNVIGDFVWYEYNKYIDILNYWDLINIYTNMQTLFAMASTKGYKVKTLEIIQASFQTEFHELFDILQNTEYNLDRLSEHDFKSIYYVKPKTVGDVAENKAEIFRWIQCINDMHEMLTGNVGKWQTILCTDGYPTIDGSRLVARGDKIG